MTCNFKNVFAAIFATVALAGCASVEDLGNAQSRIGTLESQVSLLEAKVSHIETTQNDIESKRQPQRSYCYLSGQRYTEGSVVSGRECRRSGIIVSGEAPNLSWQPRR